MANITVGVPWFRREDYARLLLLLPDAAYLPRTYDDWLLKAEDFFKEFDGTEIGAVKVIIDLDHFPAWCLANGKNLDYEARRDFAKIQVRHQIREGG